MSKGPWKPETKQNHKSPPKRFNRPAVKPVVFENETPHIPPGGAPPAGAAPLPLLTGPAMNGPEPTPGAAGGPMFDESKIKAGLGKAFCSTAAGIAAILNHALRKSAYEVQFEPVEPEMGDLWAEFAFPVLKLHLPDLEKNPHMVLVSMTALILSGKIRVKRKEVDLNVVEPERGNA